MVRENKLFVQRTKDGYFHANVLANYGSKSVAAYKRNAATVAFVKQLKSEGIEKPFISSNAGTWMHPKLFIDFAMWVSVEFKSTVIDYVLDGLIKSRNDAGEYYNQMCSSIIDRYVDHYGVKPNPLLYKKEANRIKEILGITKSRNKLSEVELSNITSMQKFNSLLISKGIGKDSRVKQLKQHSELLKL